MVNCILPLWEHIYLSQYGGCWTLIFRRRKLDMVMWYDVLSHVQLCATLWTSLPGTSVHGILQARILEGVAMPFSRGSSQPRDWTQVSHIAGRLLTVWATRCRLPKSYIKSMMGCHPSFLALSGRRLIKHSLFFGSNCPGRKILFTATVKLLV